MNNPLLACLVMVLASSGAAHGGILYGTGANSGGGLNRIDPATGAATMVGAPFGFTGSHGADFDPITRTLFIVNFSEDRLYTVNTTTGVATLVGPLGFNAITSLAFDPNTNTLYGWQINVLVRINQATGAGASLGFLGGSLTGLAFDPNTNTLYGASSSSDELFTINTATLAKTSVGGPGSLGFGSVQSLAFDAEHNILYGWDEDTSNLFTIDTTTGVGTAVGSTGIDAAYGLAYVPDPVPEPSTIATLGAGLAGLFALARARRRH